MPRFPRALRFVLLALFLLAWPGTVLAQGGPASLSCRRQCETQTRSDMPRELQACLVRCAAGEDYLARQRRAGTPEASGRGAVQGNRLPRSTLSLVAYAGPLPSTGIALSRRLERQAAHRTAQADCYRRSERRACRLLMETQLRCIAVARGVRGLGLVITRDPDTYIVVSYGVGDGMDLAAAQVSALRDCAARQEPGTVCLLAASRCG